MTETIVIHTPQEFAAMRKAGALAASILDDMASVVAPGVTTDAINALCHEKIMAAGAIPAPLGYRGFPKSVCTSVNHVVCHGIPGDRVLQEGDIVGIDVDWPLTPPVAIRTCLQCGVAGQSFAAVVTVIDFESVVLDRAPFHS